MNSRPHNVLKYAPAFVIIALLGMWGVGVFVDICGVVLYPIQNKAGASQGILYFGDGSVGFTHLAPQFVIVDVERFLVASQRGPIQIAGYFNIQRHRGNFVCQIPICCIITAMLPIAVGSFTRFQFSIRMWMIWSALIAVQCVFFASRFWTLIT